VVLSGYLAWEAGGFARIPHPDEVMHMPSLWVRDLAQMRLLDRFYNKEHPLWGVIEGH